MFAGIRLVIGRRRLVDDNSCAMCVTVVVVVLAGMSVDEWCGDCCRREEFQSGPPVNKHPTLKVRWKSLTHLLVVLRL